MNVLTRRNFVQQLIAIGAALRGAGRISIARAQSSIERSMALSYTRPAARWVEALPVGSGRLGAMVFGGVGLERLQLNEDTLWSGGPTDWDNPKARTVLPEIRRLIAEGKYFEADVLTKQALGPYTQSFLPLADVVVAFTHGDSRGGSPAVSDRRQFRVHVRDCRDAAPES